MTCLNRAPHISTDFLLEKNVDPDLPDHQILNENKNLDIDPNIL